ncbi:hypothetical protein K5D65_13460 [Pseudomonas cichorii]|nr:hypothetical protein [Pseudomonas cichorii]
MDQAIAQYPYLWRFVKDDKIDADYLEEDSESNIFQCEEVFDQDFVSEIIDLDQALLELRLFKDGTVEEHVSMLWVAAAKPTTEVKDPLILELMTSMSWIRQRFKRFKDFFAFFRVEYLEVLSDIQNHRNGYIRFCNTEPSCSPPTHCGMWLVKDMESTTPIGKLNRLKIYNAILSNSKIFMFKSEAELSGGGNRYKFGMIEDSKFELKNARIDSPKSSALELQACGDSESAPEG